MTAKCHILFLLMTAFFLLLYTSLAWSRSPMRPIPDWWYVFNIEIDADSLPPGIQYVPKGHHFINNTDKPFYLVRLVDPPITWRETLPKDVLPKMKIVSNKTFEFVPGGWRFNPSKPNQGIQFSDIDLMLKKDSKKLLASNGKGPGRPDELPEPIIVQIHGFKGSEAVTFSIKIYFDFFKGYRPDRPHYSWYQIDHATIEPSAHSDGLVVIKRKHHVSPKSLALINTSNTPFYVVRHFEEPLAWRDEVPNDTLPRLKLVSKKTYYAQYYHTKAAGNDPVKGWNLVPNSYAAISPNWAVSSTHGLKLNNIQADCRPKDIELPQAQSFSAVSFYGSEKVLIKGKLIYVLNPEYDPLAGQEIKLENICNSHQISANEDNNRQPISSERKCSSSLAGYGKHRKAECYDLIHAQKRGPFMVVIPSGEKFKNNFAISKYEISVYDWYHYCLLSGKCVITKGMERKDEPMTGISLKQVQDYIKWLSERTGKSYRLPKVIEWQYAANANGKQPKKDFNCQVKLGDKIIKRIGVASVKSGSANGWGLKNYIGNVQEWAMSETDTIMALGGYYGIAHSDCGLDYIEPHNGEADDYTGFRVLMEME